MLYSVWTLLNIGLFLFFLVLCLKATKLVREKVGFLTAIIFTFGLFSFIGQANTTTEYSPTNAELEWTAAPADTIHATNGGARHIEIANNGLSHINLDVSYAREPLHNKLVSVKASTSMTGLQGGYNWKSLSTTVDETTVDNKFMYRVSGTIIWKLMGMNIYYQDKIYIGTINLP